jgi:DNA-binding transcriptional MerR regulator
MTEKRYLTTNEAAAWLQENYDCPMEPHTLRREAKAGKIKPHRRGEGSWYYFTRERLAEYAEKRGFTRIRAS